MAVAVALLMIAGGVGWFWFLREPEPVTLRLSFPGGSSSFYRVESTSEITANLGGTGRRMVTQMEGMLRLDVQSVRSASARIESELTLLSYVANGTSLSKPRLIRQPLRVDFDGSLLGGFFMSDDGWPILSLPALSPALPDRTVQPDDVIEIDGVHLFSDKDPEYEGTTRFIKYEMVDGVQLAVLEGVLTADLREAKGNATGDVRVDIRARVDPSSGTVHDAEGALSGDISDPEFVGNPLTMMETFRLFPLSTG